MKRRQQKRGGYVPGRDMHVYPESPKVRRPETIAFSFLGQPDGRTLCPRAIGVPDCECDDLPGTIIGALQRE